MGLGRSRAAPLPPSRRRLTPITTTRRGQERESRSSAYLNHRYLSYVYFLCCNAARVSATTQLAFTAATSFFLGNASEPNTNPCQPKEKIINLGFGTQHDCVHVSARLAGTRSATARKTLLQRRRAGNYLGVVVTARRA